MPSAAGPVEEHTGNTAACVCVHVGKVCILFLVAWGTHWTLTAPLNHDAAWLLYLSTRTLSGERLYIDLIEVNPPLIVWLGMPAILLERVTGVSHANVYPVLVALAAAISLATSLRLVRHAMPGHGRLLFGAAAAIALFVLPGTSWGQREHLMVIFVLPYLIDTAVRINRGVEWKPSVPATISAAIGFAIKPHFVLSVVVVEGYAAWRTRRLSMPAIVIGVVLLAYAAAIVGVTDYLPMMHGMVSVYGASRTVTLWDMVQRWQVLVGVAALGCTVIPGIAVELRRVFGLAVAAWLIIAVLQAKGWEYHFYPAVAGSLPLAAVATAVMLRGRWAMMVVTIALTVGAVITQPSVPAWRWPQIAEAVRATDGKGTLILSEYVSHAWPAATYGGSSWLLPSPSLWPARTTGGKDLAVQWTLSALEKRPAIVLVTTHAPADVLPILLTDEQFRHAWAAYSESGQAGHFRVFRPVD